MQHDQSYPKQNERELPTEIQYFTNGHVHRRFTWSERIKILFGFSALLEIHIATQHRPGRTQPVVKLNLTANSNPQAALNEFAHKVQEEKRAREELVEKAKAERFAKDGTL